MAAKPEYMIRSDDFMVFSLNRDRHTYSLHDQKLKYPYHAHIQYPYKILVHYNFIPATEAELPMYKKKQDEFYANMYTELSETRGNNSDDDGCR